MHRIRILLAFLVPGLFLAPAPAQGAAATGGLALEKIAPADVFAFVSFAGLERCSAAGAELGLHRLWREPEVQTFLGAMIQGFEAAAGQAPEEARQQWDLAKRLLGGRMALVVGGLNLVWNREVPIPMPGAVLALDLGAHREEFAGVLEQLRAAPALRRALPGFAQETRSYRGHEICVLRQERRGPAVKLCFTYAGNLFLAGLNETLLHRCLDNLAGGGQTLAALPAFQRARAKGAAEPLVEFFLNVESVASRLAGLVPDEWLGALHDLGLDGIRGLYYASAVHDGDSFETLYMDAPAPRRGLLNLPSRPVSSELLAFVPKDACWCEGWGLDLEAAWDVVAGVLPRLLPPRGLQKIQKGLERTEARLGLKLREELLAALGPEIIGFMQLRPGLAIPEFVCAVGVRNRELVDRLLAVLPGQLGLDARALPFRDHTMHVITLPERALFQPSLAVVGSRLVLSLNPSGLKDVIRRHLSPEGGIADNPSFQEAFRGLQPIGAEYVSFLDLKAGVAFGYGLAETFLPGFAGRIRLPVDLALLPAREVVLRHVRALAAASTCDQDGFACRGRTLGTATVLALLCRFLDQAPGIPPMTLQRVFNQVDRQIRDSAPFGGPGVVNPLPPGDPGEADQRQAVESLSRQIEQRPNQGSLHFQRGHALHRLREFGAATADFQRAVELGFQAPTAAYNIACCCALQGQRDEAFAWIDEALAAGFANWALIEQDGDLANLRTDPRWAALMSRRR